MPRLKIPDGRRVNLILNSNDVEYIADNFPDLDLSKVVRRLLSDFIRNHRTRADARANSRTADHNPTLLERAEKLVAERVVADD
jgi:hypothetical protein